MGYDAKKDWAKIYAVQSNMAWPAEGVIRILKGNFPGLLMPNPTFGKILDMGCGDGRHFPLFESIGLLGYGTEISVDICENTIHTLEKRGIVFGDVLKGTTDNLPYSDCYFDYLLTWNSCYYMSAGADSLDFTKHVHEMWRVLRKDGWIVCSIPKKSCFIYRNSKPAKTAGFRVIAKDPWGYRKGEIMKCFESRDDIEKEFGDSFGDFCHADIEMDGFGLNYHWHIFVAKLK